MNITTILQSSEQQYPDNEKAFLANLGLKLLEQAQIFSLLEGNTNIKKKLTEILEQEAKVGNGFKPFHGSPDLFGKKEIKEISYKDRFDHIAYIQRNILSCPTNDEHVLLLTSLKALEELGEDVDYKGILKEILLKNLHKIENIHHHEAFIGRQKEMSEINRVLGRSFRNNVLIIGATGIGKTTLAEEVKLHSGTTRVYQLFPGNSLFFDQIVSIIASAEGKPVLLLMDELFTFDAAQIKYAIDNCQVIGTANDSAFKKFAAENPGIISRFEVVRIEEPEMSEVKEILTYHQKRLSQSHHVLWEEKFTDELISLAKQYLTEQYFPAKGISLLEEATFFAKAQGLSTVTAEMVRSIISQKTNIPIGSLTEFDKKDLSLLPDKLATKVKGQDEAITRVSRVIQRSKLGFGKKNRPIGSFLFVGPSGVGKTELAKALAKEIFGDEEAMVRLDMSEFAEAHTVQRLIGAPPGYIGFEEGGQLTNPIRTKPYNLVLLDEIEKAHPRIFDIFLQVLDDGRLTDGQGKVVDFKNTVIVATSNAGIEDILDLIAEGKSQGEIEKELKEILTDYFRIEFINRFDDIVIFNALTPEALEGVGKLQIEKLRQALQKRKIDFSVSEQTLKYLANEGCDPRYGARGLLRLLQEKIENKLAEMIISGELQEGQRIEF